MNEDYKVLKEIRAIKTIEKIYNATKRNSVTGFINSRLLVVYEIVCYFLSVLLFVFAFYFSNVASVLLTQLGVEINAPSEIEHLKYALNTIRISMFFIALIPIIPAYLLRRLRKRIRDLNQVQLIAKNFLFD